MYQNRAKDSFQSCLDQQGQDVSMKSDTMLTSPESHTDTMLTSPELQTDTILTLPESQTDTKCMFMIETNSNDKDNNLTHVKNENEVNVININNKLTPISLVSQGGQVFRLIPIDNRNICLGAPSLGKNSLPLLSSIPALGKVVTRPLIRALPIHQATNNSVTNTTRISAPKMNSAIDDTEKSKLQRKPYVSKMQQKLKEWEKADLKKHQSLLKTPSVFTISSSKSGPPTETSPKTQLGPKLIPFKYLINGPNSSNAQTTLPVTTSTTSATQHCKGAIPKLVPFRNILKNTDNISETVMTPSIRSSWSVCDLNGESFIVPDGSIQNKTKKASKKKAVSYKQPRTKKGTVASYLNGQSDDIILNKANSTTRTSRKATKSTKNSKRSSNKAQSTKTGSKKKASASVTGQLDKCTLNNTQSSKRSSKKASTSAKEKTSKRASKKATQSAKGQTSKRTSKKASGLKREQLDRKTDSTTRTPKTASGSTVPGYVGRKRTLHLSDEEKHLSAKKLRQTAVSPVEMFPMSKLCEEKELSDKAEMPLYVPTALSIQQDTTETSISESISKTVKNTTECTKTLSLVDNISNIGPTDSQINNPISSCPINCAPVECKSHAEEPADKTGSGNQGEQPTENIEKQAGNSAIKESDVREPEKTFQCCFCKSTEIFDQREQFYSHILECHFAAWENSVLTRRYCLEQGDDKLQTSTYKTLKKYIKDKRLIILSENTGKFKCRFCNASFWFVEYLKKHLAMEHIRKNVHFDKQGVDNVSSAFEDLALPKKINFIDKESEDHGKDDLQNLVFGKGDNFRVQMTQVNTTDEELLFVAYKIGCWKCVNCQNCHFSGPGDLSKGLRKHWEEKHGSDNVLLISLHWTELEDLNDLLGDATHNNKSESRNHRGDQGVENETKNLQADGIKNETRNLKGKGTNNEINIDMEQKMDNNKRFENVEIANFESKTDFEREDNCEIKCEKCEKMFINKNQCEKHMCVESSQYARNAKKCVICDIRILSDHWYSHMKLHGETIRNGACEICFVHFPRDKMQYHRMVFHQLGPQCQICGKFFIDKAALAHHEETVVHHINNKPEMFKCEMCDEPFSYNSDLMLHKLIKHNVAEHECKFCQEKFLTEFYYLSHMKRAHVKCPVCDIYFCNEKSLGDHPCKPPENKKKKRIRKKAKKSTEKALCDRCGAYVMKISLAAHMEKHSETGFYCDQCGKRFANKTSLRWHYYSHKDTILTCKICDRVYTKRSGLHSHIQLIHRPRKHKCPTCGMLFLFGFLLQNHVQSVHEKKVRFSCSLCSFATFYKMNFNLHIASQH